MDELIAALIRVVIIEPIATSGIEAAVQPVIDRVKAEQVKSITPPVPLLPPFASDDELSPQSQP